MSRAFSGLGRRYSLPAHDFYRRDLYDRDETVTAETVARDYGNPRIKSVVYPAYVEASDLSPSVDYDEPYDWESLDARARMPVPKVIVHRDGRMEIEDGNHRVHFWQDAGYVKIPVWIIDERPGVEPPEDAPTDFAGLGLPPRGGRCVKYNVPGRTSADYTREGWRRSYANGGEILYGRRRTDGVEEAYRTTIPRRPGMGCPPGYKEA